MVSAMTTPRTAVPDTLTDAELAIVAASAGADVVRRAYGRVHTRTDKSPTDFATEADLDAEAAIRRVIAEARPADGFVGEELGDVGAPGAARRWLVDPLCGTLNFAATTPLCAVNVALATGDAAPTETVSVAAVADPVAGDLFWTGGSGAWARAHGTDTPLFPSSASRMVSINVDSPAPSAADLGPRLVLDPALRTAFSPRVHSTTLAVAWVAAGRQAAYVTDGDLRGSVHFTAGIALCRAAGCVVTNLGGGPVDDGPGLIAAADTEVHAKLLEIVQRVRGEA
jgi:myo-inositol-1(or 4)-monophosphatase